MKWITFISCLFLISFAESKPREYRDVELHDSLNHYNHLPDDVFRAISLALSSQYLQLASYEDVEKVTNDFVELFKKCKADSHSEAACAKHLRDVFLDEICHEEDICTRLKLTECCAKVDPERNECILSHKNDTPGFIPPYQKPSVEEGCKAYEDNKALVISHYLHELGRRTPLVNMIVIIHAAKEYQNVFETCCHAEDKEGCFKEKATAIKAAVTKQVQEQQVACSILRKPGKRALGAVKLATLSQKFPKANLETIVKLANDIVHIHEQVCKGDTVESLTERAELVDYICQHKDEISSKLGPCCEKPLLDRTACIVALENDDKPADLSPTVEGFIQDPETCKHFTEDGEKHLTHFLYEYSRRHCEYSPQLLVRVAHGYEELLKKCCPAENSKECLGEGEALLKKHIADSLEFLSTNCELHQTLGDYAFQGLLLLGYSKKAPQLKNDELIKYTGKLTQIAKDCCQLDDNHKLVCAEGKTDYVLGLICLRHEHHHINNQVCKCCSESLSHRRECFSGLGVDPSYVPVPFEPEFHEDLCSPNEDEKKIKKQNLLINLVKHRPTLTLDQQQVVSVDFNTLVDQCCKAENHEGCFKEEGPKLVQKVKDALGEH